MNESAIKRDGRYVAFRRGLDQLNTPQLHVLSAHLDAALPIALDGYNFDPMRGLWCPLAIGLGVPAIAVETANRRPLTNARAKELILEVGRLTRNDFSLNPLAGVNGWFFRSHRMKDLRFACRSLLMERGIAEEHFAH